MALEGRILKRANPNTIQDKFLVGYQGWFTCPGDGPPVHKGHHGWLHWFNKPISDGGQPTIDLWPDVSAYTPDELYPVPWYTTSLPPSSSLPRNCPSSCTLPTSEPHTHPLLFSSRHPKTVQRHFNWMAQHSVDGVFLQRFAGQCEADGNPHSPTADIMRLRDEVLDRVREAAEKEGRVWAVMYDVSGVPDEKIERVIRVDWAHLLWEKRVLESSWYLREEGRPVVALWGFGFSSRGHSPSTVRSIVHYIRSITPGGAYIMAGTPTHWATLRGDADPNPDFFPMWFEEFDAISPWTVGRFSDEEGIDRFAREKLKTDLEKIRDPSNNTRGRKIDYVPVVFPGSSGFNLSHGKWTFNEQPRDGGRFLWRQIYQVKRVTGARIVYGAMWDEYDEGTAFLPVVSKKRELPREGRFLALDVDGYDLPPDWYMRIAGFIGEIIRGEREVGETFPVKDLQDYWSSHPHYELLPAPGTSQPVASGSSSGESGVSGSGGGRETQTFQEWYAKEGAKIEDVPPPPYSLEATNSQPVPAQVGGPDSQVPSQQRQPQPQPNQAHQPPVPTQTRPTSLPTQPPSTSTNSNWNQNQDGSGRQASDGRPPVPLQSRPSLSNHPPPPTSLQHAHTYGHGPAPGPPAPPLGSRPTSYPTPSSHPASDAPTNTNPGSSANVPYRVYNPSKPPGTSGTSPRPGEVFHHPDYSPGYLPNAVPLNAPYQPQQPQQLNWDTRPRPSTSVSDLDERFKHQCLNEKPYASTSPTPTSPSTGQWPPPEWGMQPQGYSPSRPQAPLGSPPPPPPAARPSPSHLPPPPLHPANRPSGGSRPSPSPRPQPAGGGVGPGMPSPGPGYGQGLGGFPAPHSPPSHSQPPYAQYMMPYAGRPPHSTSSESEAAYPSAYPDVMQSWMGGGGGAGGGGMPSQGGRSPVGYGEQYGDGVGGFYPGPGSSSGSGSGPGMGSSVGYPPPPIPARPSSGPLQVPSILPGQIMPSTSSAPAPSSSQASGSGQGQGQGPGGFIPGAGRFGELGSRLQSTGSKVMSADAWKRVEGGIGSLSSAGSKVYQRFRS